MNDKTIKRLFLSAVLLIGLCCSAQAQSLDTSTSPKVALAKPERQQIAVKRRITFNWSDGFMLGGGIFDVAASQGKQEAGVLGHGQTFPAGANIGVKAGVYGLIKTAEYFYPDHPRLIRCFKIGIGVGWGVAGLVSSRR